MTLPYEPHNAMPRARLYPLLATLCAALAALDWATAAAGASGQPVWELRPYRIQIFLGFAARPEFGGQLPATLAGRLAERTASLQGGAWNVTAVPAPEALQQAMSASLAGVTAEVLPKEALQADKVMLVEVSAAGGGYQVAARELDVATGLWSALVARPFAHLLKLPDACSAAVFEAFAPLARLSALKDRQVVLRLRASALKPRDPALAPVKPGGVFRLVALPVAAEGGAGEGQAAPRATPIPWSFCTVEEIAQDELRGRLETGLQDPLPDRWETSLEVLALAVVPPRRPTILTLKASAPPSLPLPGYEVYASPPGAASPVLLGRTDRQGSLQVPPADHLLQIVLVRHGDQWLVRLPMVPGLEPRLSAAVAHNDHRIELDGRVAALRDAVVDLAARRQMLLGRAKARIAAKQLAEAEQAIKQLRELPAAAEELVASRIAEAKKDLSGDAASLARLDAVQADYQQALAAQFDAKEIDELAAQLEPSKTDQPKTDQPKTDHGPAGGKK